MATQPWSSTARAQDAAEEDPAAQDDPTAQDVPAAQEVLTAQDVPAAQEVPTAQDVPAAQEVVPSGEEITHPYPADVYPGDYLFDYINGGAPLYLEYGFHEVASQELETHGRTYIFDVYRMASPLAAWGIFSVRRPAGAPILEGLPYSSFTTYQGMAAHGPFYFDISAYESNAQTASEMAQLARIAVSKTPPAFGNPDLTAGEPFTHLPATGRLPGSERLARGPISVRAALGSAYAGTLERVLEAILTADWAPPTSAASSGPGGMKLGPWWVVCGYHPRPQEDERLMPQTTLAVFVTGADPSPLLKAAGHAAKDALRREELSEGRGWMWRQEDGARGCVLRRGGDLIVATSVLPDELFRAWTQQLATQ